MKLSRDGLEALLSTDVSITLRQNSIISIDGAPFRGVYEVIVATYDGTRQINRLEGTDPLDLLALAVEKTAPNPILS